MQVTDRYPGRSFEELLQAGDGGSIVSVHIGIFEVPDVLAYDELVLSYETESIFEVCAGGEDIALAGFFHDDRCRNVSSGPS